MSKFTERKKKEREAARAARRAEEREEARAEQLRQQALEREQEFQREADRERERREEALALARELEAAAEKALLRRQKYRETRRQERREVRASQRIAATLNAARQARQQEEEREDAREERRSEERAAERAAEDRSERRAVVREETQQQERQARYREELRAEQREETNRQIRIEERREERRSESRKEERQEAARQERTQDQQAARERTDQRAQRPRRGQRLPAGVLSGNLPWLRIEGRYLADEYDRVVTLRGVTLRGFERAEPAGEVFRPAASPALIRAIASWNANALLIPFAQDLALEGSGEAQGDDYLQALDQTIANASAAGLYTIIQLALVSSNLPTSVGPGGDVYDPALPNLESIDLWAILANRYADEPAVIFHLFRSPHNPGQGDSTAALLPQLGWDTWQLWLLAMLGEIRRNHPRALVVAPGVNAGSDLSGFPLSYTDGTKPANVMYSAELRPGSYENVLLGLERLGRTECVGGLPWMATPNHVSVVTRIGARLARLGIHWITDDWLGSEMQLAVQRRGHYIATQLGSAFRLTFQQPTPPEANLIPTERLSR